MRELEEIREVFEKYSEDNEFLDFDKAKNKKSNRADLHGLILLDELFPGSNMLINAAEHDQIWFSISEEGIRKLTDEQILELSRCGIFLGDEFDSLTMFI